MGTSEPFPKARLGDKTTNVKKNKILGKTTTLAITQKALLKPERPYILT